VRTVLHSMAAPLSALAQRRQRASRPAAPRDHETGP
jgi:hypothetical protein